MILCAPSFWSEVSGEAAYARLLARALREIVPGARIYALRPDQIAERRRIPLLRGPVIFSRAPLWPRALPLRIKGVPVSFVLHGVEAWKRYPPLARWVFKGAVFLAVSRYTAERFLHLNRLSAPWHLLPPALDPDFGTHPARLRVLDPYIVTVARLSSDAAYKGVDLVIQALARLREDFPRLHYLVVGGGDLLPGYHQLARRLGIGERVHFLGERREVAPFLAGARLFLLVSQGEGFGISFLEAMYFRKPLLGARAGGIPEVVRHGQNGLLVPYGDLEALTAALQELLTQKEMARQMGETGFRILQEEYVYPRFRERLRRILGELGWV